jgi:hypothetical protein
VWVKIQSNNARVGGGGGVVVLSLLCESEIGEARSLSRSSNRRFVEIMLLISRRFDTNVDYIFVNKMKTCDWVVVGCRCLHNRNTTVATKTGETGKTR